MVSPKSVEVMNSVSELVLGHQKGTLAITPGFGLIQLLVGLLGSAGNLHQDMLLGA